METSLRFTEKIKPLLDLLESDSHNTRWEGANALFDMRASIISISKEEQEQVLTALENSIKVTGTGLPALDAIGGIERVKHVITESTAGFYDIGWYLTHRPSPMVLEELWKAEGDKQIVVRCLLSVIEDPDEDPEVNRHVERAVNFLVENAEAIPYKSYKAVINGLQPTSGDSPNRRDFKEASLTEIKKYEVKISQPQLFILLDSSTDVDLQIDAVQKLLQLKSPQVTRDLINRWWQWVVYGDRALLTATITKYLRRSTEAVLPLVENLSKKVEINDALRENILYQELSDIQLDLVLDVFKKFDHRKDSHKQASFGSQENEKVPQKLLDSLKDSGYEAAQKLLDSLEERSDAFKNLKHQSDWGNLSWDTKVEKIVEQLFLEQLLVREERVQQQIFKQLAEMSDRRFFEESGEEYDDMLEELAKHALPVIAARLPKEANINQREYMARLLSNFTLREAKDALVLAVVGEERTRAARQELLAKYYLDPSKQRSDEAARILTDAVGDARQTLKVLRWLNITVFVVGIMLLLLGTTTALISQELSTRVLGALAGLGGLAGILLEMIRSPLERIQNAMADLVQIETAFTSFIWELNLNGTFIQSQYVAEGKLDEYEISETVKRIEDAMILAMNQVSVYTKVGQQRVLSRIYDLSPAAGPAGSQVTVHGQHMTGDKTEKKKHTGILAIDHKPIKAENLKWEDQEVSFKLPQKLPGTEKVNGTIWISLLIDGMETNALPFHLIEEGK